MTRMTVLAAVFALVGSAFAGQARAGIESDVLVCSGRVAAGTLTRSTSSSSANWIRCTITRARGASVSGPTTWYDGPAASYVVNNPVAAHVRRSSGELEFAVGSRTWAVQWYDVAVDGVMAFANGSSDDNVHPAGAYEPPYRIQAGYVRDVDRCPDEWVFPHVPGPCNPVEADRDFWFVAERVYDLPV